MDNKLLGTKTESIDCPHFPNKKVRVKTNKMGRYGGEGDLPQRTYNVTTCLDADKLKLHCIKCDNNERPI